MNEYSRMILLALGLGAVIAIVIEVLYSIVT